MLGCDVICTFNLDANDTVKRQTWCVCEHPTLQDPSQTNLMYNAHDLHCILGSPALLSHIQYSCTVNCLFEMLGAREVPFALQKTL